MKIAFLFLVISTIYHESYWQDFFKGHEHYYSVYVHAKKPFDENSIFKQHELPYKVPTTWSNTIKAQVAMLKTALEDPENTSFVFLSDATIPLHDFDTTYHLLMQDNASHFYYERNPHMQPGNPYYSIRNLAPIPTEYQFKNSQWVVLNRFHAQLFVDDTATVEFIASKGSDQELLPGTLLALHEQLHTVKPIDRTLVIWDREPAPYRFDDLTKHPEDLEILRKAIEEKQFLFVRKIAQECDLTPLQPYLSYCSSTSHLRPMQTNTLTAGQ